MWNVPGEVLSEQNQKEVTIAKSHYHPSVILLVQGEGVVCRRFLLAEIKALQTTWVKYIRSCIFFPFSEEKPSLVNIEGKMSALICFKLIPVGTSDTRNILKHMPDRLPVTPRSWLGLRMLLLRKSGRVLCITMFVIVISPKTYITSLWV